MIQARLRGYFNSELFNTIVGEYFKNFLDEFVKHYVLVSAKGSSGQIFQTGDSRFDKVVNQYDMPYHIHIVNGLLPALKLLEERFKKEGWLERKESPLFLRCFIVGFTLHDVNKLTGIDDLNESVEHSLVSLCEILKVEQFFPEWKDWVEEIEFLALGTEYRTKIYAHQKSIKEHDFFNTVLAEHCHFADSIASMEGVSSVTEFYEQLCNKQMDGRRLADLWQLSFVEVQENIFTLLSQKLLFAAKSLIQDERQQTTLFSLRNGFVYIGEALNEDEILKIKTEFTKDLFDYLSLTQIGTPDTRSCNFNFLEMTELNNEMLDTIIKVGMNGNNPQIRFLTLGNNEPIEAIQIINQLADEYELPIKVQQRVNTNSYGLYLEKEWDDLQDDQLLLKLIAFKKIKLLKAKEFPEWKEQISNVMQINFSYSFNGKEYILRTMDELLAKFEKPASQITVEAIVRACEIKKRASNFEKYVNEFSNDIISKFTMHSKKINTSELNIFVEAYLTGNFNRNIENILNNLSNIPDKKNMCMFTGKTAQQDYTDNKAFGVKARGFSNRSSNTLKNDANKVSSLFFYELALRKKELPRGFYTKKLKEEDKNNLDRQMFLDASGANAVIYYDFGEYFVDISSRQLLNVLSKAFSYDCRDINGLTLIFDKYAYDFNLYGMNFNRIGEDVESNFYFIHQMLKLIQKTGFRIFVSGILTPYHTHKEMFVFENCMPFVKKLGWDRIRIDQIESKLQEMNLLLSLNAKRLVSNVLNYAKDKQYIFTAFALLDDDDKTKAQNTLVKFINLNKEMLKMSVMNDLAQIAIEMVRPKSGSTSQESWIIRDSLKVLKDCHKEGRDKNTAIEQIAGDLRKTLKSKDYPDLSKCEPFAKTLYEQLFEQEWKKHFPQPGRLRNWINQFAFLYSDKGYMESRKSKIKSIIKKLKDEGKDISEDTVIQSLVIENKKLEKYADDYREVFQKVVLEIK